MPTKQVIYAQKTAKLIKQAQSLTKENIRDILRLLEDTRREVGNMVATTDWQLYNLTSLKNNTDKIIKEFKAMYVNILDDADKRFWGLGVDFVDESLKTAGLILPLPDVDMKLLSVLQGYSSDLITGLTDEAIKNINSQITLSLMGGKSPYDAMKAIGRNLNGKSVFSSIGARAEAIATTEMNRALSMAEQARLEEASKNVEGMEKQWFHSSYVRNPRSAHVEMDGVHVPVNEPFIIIDADGTEVKMMMPRDPGTTPAAYAARHSISCHCYIMPYNARWEAFEKEMM